jgi:hypothetical protein
MWSGGRSALARKPVVLARDREEAANGRAMSAHERLALPRRPLTFVRGESTSGYRPSMEILGCRLDVSGRRNDRSRLCRGEGGANFAIHPSLLMSYPRTAFWGTAVFACCKSLIGWLYATAGGHRDSFFASGRSERQRSSATCRRPLPRSFRQVARRGSLPSASRRAVYSREVVPRQTELTPGIAEARQATTESPRQ